MTPEEIAAEYTKENSWARPIMVAVIRERDAAWREAVGKLSDDCDLYCLDPTNACDDAAALRALLEEAGSNEK